MDNRCLRISSDLALKMATKVIEFIKEKRVCERDKYIQSLIDGYNNSFWRFARKPMSLESFDPCVFNAGELFLIHKFENCLLEDEEEIAVKLRSTAQLSLEVSPDNYLWISVEEAYILQTYGRD